MSSHDSIDVFDASSEQDRSSRRDSFVAPPSLARLWNRLSASLPASFDTLAPSEHNASNNLTSERSSVAGGPGQKGGAMLSEEPSPNIEPLRFQDLDAPRSPIDDEACYADDLQGKIDFLSSLPHEVSLYILLHLDFRSLLEAMLVSRHWNLLARDNLLWRDLFHQESSWHVREDLVVDPSSSPFGGDPDSPTLKSSSLYDMSTPTKRNASDPSSSSSPVGVGRRITELMTDLSSLAITSLTGATSSARGGTPSGPSKPSSSQLTPPSLSSSSSHESSVSGLHTPVRYRGRSSSTSPHERAVHSSKLGYTPTAPLFLNWPKLYKDRYLLEQRWKRGVPSTSIFTGHLDSVYCLQFDDRKVISGSRDRTVQVWDINTKACIKTLWGHQGSILCLQYDDKVLMTGSSDCRVLIWDLVGDKATGEGRWRVIKALVGHNMGVLDLRFDDKWIVSCSKDTTIRVWHRDSGELYRILSGHGGPVNGVQLVNDKVISASGDSLVKLWDINTGEILRVFTGHQRGLACVQCSPSGKLIATGSNDKLIKVWDAESGQCIKTLEGHSDLVRSLAFDETRRRLVSASYDRTLRVWDLDSGDVLLRFRAHTSLIFDVAFSASKILSCGHDRKITILDFGVGLDVSRFI